MSMRSTSGWLLAAVVTFVVPGMGGCELDGEVGERDAGQVDGASGTDGGTGVDAATGADAAGGADAVAGTDGSAGAEVCPVVDYSACGGDLLGTWAFLDLCPEDPEAAAALCEHPYDDRPACTGDGNEAVCDSSHTGTLTFHDDGSIDVDTEVTIVATWNFTDACLEVASPGAASPEDGCGQMANDRLTCNYDGHCSCVSDPMVQGDQNTGTYEIRGDEVILGDDPPATYCVDGDRLTMDYYLYHPVSWRFWVLERG